MAEVAKPNQTNNVKTPNIPTKSLHELMMDGLKQATLGISAVEDYRDRLAQGKSAEKPQLSLALKQFPDVFNTPNPDAPTSKPGEKLLDFKLQTLAVGITQVRQNELGPERAPLKAASENSEKYIDMLTKGPKAKEIPVAKKQELLDQVVSTCFKNFDQLPSQYGPLFVIAEKKSEYKITTSENTSNFLKTIYIQALEQKYPDSGLDIKKHLPKDPSEPQIKTPEVANADLKATTKVEPKTASPHPAVIQLKESLDKAKTTPAVPVNTSNDTAQVKQPANSR